MVEDHDHIEIVKPCKIDLTWALLTQAIMTPNITIVGCYVNFIIFLNQFYKNILVLLHNHPFIKRDKPILYIKLITFPIFSIPLSIVWPSSHEKFLHKILE